MPDDIPVSRAGKVVYYSPRPRRPWRRLWWLPMLLPFAVAVIVDWMR